MSNTMAIRVSPSFQSLKPRNPSLYFSHSYNGFLPILRNLSTPETRTNSLLRTTLVCQNEIRGRIGKASTWSVNESVEDLNAPVSIDLEQIVNEGQFDRIVGEAQQLEVPVVIVWMASWCRKCIYLKPKLEKLAADYHPRIRFYCIDVNTVPHRLVSRAGVTKMPTIQLWKDCKKQAEVIGGHKAHLVVNEVREMIENEVLCNR